MSLVGKKNPGGPKKKDCWVIVMNKDYIYKRFFFSFIDTPNLTGTLQTCRIFERYTPYQK